MLTVKSLFFLTQRVTAKLFTTVEWIESKKFIILHERALGILVTGTARLQLLFIIQLCKINDIINHRDENFNSFVESSVDQMRYALVADWRCEVSFNGIMQILASVVIHMMSGCVDEGCTPLNIYIF